jgi:hypothetical protein
VAKTQIDRFVPSKAAGEQDRQECAIAFALQVLGARRIPEPLRLFRVARNSGAIRNKHFSETATTRPGGSVPV